MRVDFRPDGLRYTAINGGPEFTFEYGWPKDRGVPDGLN